jgi:signal transduction histidine kinase
LKPGIRLQIGLALAGLFVLGFVPLFFAVASLGRATLLTEREKSARQIGRVVAARVAEAQGSRAPGELAALVDAQLGSASGLYALGMYDTSGAAVVRAGDPETAQGLPLTVITGRESVRGIATRHGPALEVTVPGPRGAVVAVLRTDEEVSRSGALVRLVGLYTLLVGVALLVFVYFALTRLVVRPIDTLSQAARRVADGGRLLERPHAGAAELVDLGSSLAAMTERLRAEESALRDKVSELERATAELRAAQTHLVASERLASVGRLAAGLAHEVGNPLAAVMGLQDLLIEGGLEPEEERDFLARMRKETERIHRILRDLLDYARPNAGRAPDRPDEPGRVDQAVGDVLNLMRPQKTMRDIDLAMDVERELPPVALSHEQLTQVVLNLVSNAAEATGDKGRVALTARADGNAVELVVEDDGPGIDPSVASTLFEPFVTTKEVGKGTGLGLAVCRGLVEGAGGTITAGPRPDGARGARFVVRLPKGSPPSSAPKRA